MNLVNNDHAGLREGQQVGNDLPELVDGVTIAGWRIERMQKL